MNISRKLKTDLKITWQYIKSKTKLRTVIPEVYMNTDKKLTETDSKKAETLSNIFASVYVEEPSGVIPTLGMDKNITHPLHNLQITPEVVDKKLTEINVNKLCGPDGLHSYILKTLASELSISLSIILNSSLKQKQLPKEWKQANVSAIFKKGESKNPANYRPVSLTSIVCKTMKKIIRDHITNHIKKINCFTTIKCYTRMD